MKKKTVSFVRVASVQVKGRIRPAGYMCDMTELVYHDDPFLLELRS